MIYIYITYLLGIWILFLPALIYSLIHARNQRIYDMYIYLWLSGPLIILMIPLALAGGLFLIVMGGFVPNLLWNIVLGFLSGDLGLEYNGPIG
jgi:hypothetical protein